MEDHDPLWVEVPTAMLTFASLGTVQVKFGRREGSGEAA
jgi:hypothetical protein